jgi:Ca-activated chloride channel family protein
MKDIKLLLLAVILLFLLSFIEVPAQDDEIRVETNLVTMNVAVTDKNGNYIKNLSAADFEVFDGKVKREIEQFSSEDAPVYFGIVYDLGNAEQTRNVLEALRRFAGQLGAEDDYFVTVFNERGSLTTDFVPTSEQIAANLENNKTNSLYDAIVAASQKVRTRKNAKQVLLVLTDGEDNASRNSLKDLRLDLRSVNLPVYTVTFDKTGGSAWNYTNVNHWREPRKLDQFETSELSKAALDEICKTSGGQSFEKTIYNRLYLYTIFTKILTEVENQYVIGFYPENTDGKWHKLKVRVNAENGRALKLSNRKGYQSPKG